MITLQQFIFIFRGEYSVTNYGTVRVCLHGVINSFGQMFYTIDRYISFILNLLSITSLLITLITYIIFKELRNLPGLNLMCLAFSILTSRVRMLFISQNIILLFFRWFSCLEEEMSLTNLDVALWLSLCILLPWPLSSGPM